MADSRTLTREGEIVEGPGKWHLMMAIMEGQHVEFTRADHIGDPLVVRVNTLQAEDGNPDRVSWNIQGHGGDPMAMKGLRIPGTQPLIWDVKIYYHSGKRKGHYELTYTY